MPLYSIVRPKEDNDENKCCLVNSAEWKQSKRDAIEYNRIKDEYFELKSENSKLKEQLKNENPTITIQVETVTCLPNPDYCTSDGREGFFGDTPSYKQFKSIIDNISLLVHEDKSIELPRDSSLVRILKKTETKVRENILKTIEEKYDKKIIDLLNERDSYSRKYNALLSDVKKHDEKCIFKKHRIIKDNKE